MSVMRARRQPASLSASRTADQKDREQIRRLLSQPQKAAAGPVGSVIGNAEAASSTYTGDAYGIAFTGWTFTTHDYWPGGGAPVLVSSGSDEFDPSAPGWYIAQVSVSVVVSGTTPAFARIEVNGDSTSNTDATVIDVRPFLDSGIKAVVTTGPFYHPGPGVANHFLGARLSWPTTPSISSASVSYLLSRIA